MNARRLGGLAVVTASVVASFAMAGLSPSAGATTNMACAVTAGWVFSPPLALAAQTGDFKISGSRTCAADGPEPCTICVTQGPSGTEGTYIGNCVFATATNGPWTYQIIGGLVVVGTQADKSAQFVGVLVPASGNPCAMDQATGIHVLAVERL